MQKNINKEALILLGSVIFIAISIIASNLLHFAPGIILSIIFALITIKSKDPTQKVFGVIGYLIFFIKQLTSSSYNAFSYSLLGIALISAVFYVYSDEYFLSNNTAESKSVIQKATNLLICLILVGIMLVFYFILQEFWKGTFLEIGAEVGYIVFIVTVITAFSKKIDADYQKKIDYAKKLKNDYKKMLEQSIDDDNDSDLITEERKSNTNSNLPKLSEDISKQIPKNNSAIQEAKYFAEIEKQKKERQNTIIKILSIWLLIIDVSILGYLFAPNNTGFNFIATLICITIIAVTFLPEGEDESVYNLIYSKLRPFQAIAFLLLLIAHNQEFSWALGYACIVALLHIVWILGYINLKTFFTITILVYTLPIFGYFSNPYRQISEETPTISSVIFQKKDITYENPIKNLGETLDQYTMSN